MNSYFYTSNSFFLKKEYFKFKSQFLVNNMNLRNIIEISVTLVTTANN